jgi:DUF1365 family protein
VAHTRLRPFRRRFHYPVCSLLLDLDELPHLDRTLQLFSHDRWNCFSFFTRDYGPADGSSLQGWFEDHLQRAGLPLTGGSVRILCFPRLFGFAFNSLSAWMYHDTTGHLRAVLYEIRNPFGQRHSYLFPVDAPVAGDFTVTHHCRKAFFISPRVPMDVSYDFTLRVVGSTVAVTMNAADDEGYVLLTSLTGRRVPLEDANLGEILWRFPLFTFWTYLGIWWQGLQIGRFTKTRYPQPPTPSLGVSYHPGGRSK